MSIKQGAVPNMKGIWPSLLECFYSFYGWSRRVKMLSARPRSAIPSVREMAKSAWHLYVLLHTRITITEPPAEANWATIEDVDPLCLWMRGTAQVLAQAAEAAGKNDDICVKLARQFRDEERKIIELEKSIGREKAVSAAVEAGILKDSLVEDFEPDAFGD